MRRMQIGFWGGYDPEAWAAFGDPRINGIELALCPNEEHLAAAAAQFAANGMPYGIHAPGLAREAYTLPALTSTSPQERAEALARASQEIELAARYGADYVLMHYPYPSIFPREYDPVYRRAMPTFPHYEANEMTPGLLRSASEPLFAWLVEMQVKTNQRVVLEYDFFGDEEDTFVSMFRQYPEIGLVVDTQRLDVHRRVFPSFDPYRWLDAVAPYVYLVHHSNTRYENGKFVRHLPVLPEHDQDPAYGDAHSYLRYLAERNDRFHVTLEHNPRAVTREQLAVCYATVRSLLDQGPSPAPPTS